MRAPLRRASSLSEVGIHELGAGRAVVLDGVLGEEAAQQLARDLAVYDAALVPAGMGRGAYRWLDQTERGDEITWIERSGASLSVRSLCDRFDGLMDELNRRAYLGLRRYDLQLARYRVAGARYARHSDAFRARLRRRVTAIYYVNPDWRPEDGGALRVYGEDGGAPIDIEPLLDRMVVFLSDRVDHEVLPSFRERTALTAWYYDADGVLP